MRKSLPKLLLLLALHLPNVSCADSATGGWNELRSLYDSGKVDDALLLLQKNPGSDASYFYNVGTLYLRAQKPGPAVSYLEKAFRLQPLDPDIRYNLELARTALVRVIGSDRQDPASSFLDLCGDQLALAPARAALALLSCALIFLSIRSYARSRSFRSWLLAGLGPLGALLLLGSAILADFPSFLGAHRPAFALEQQALRSGPGEQFLELGQVQAGTRLRVLDSAAQSSPGEAALWYQVRYGSDGIGWVKSSRMLIL